MGTVGTNARGMEEEESRPQTAPSWIHKESVLFKSEYEMTILLDASCIELLCVLSCAISLSLK